MADAEFREGLIAAFTRAFPSFRREEVPSRARLELMGGADALPAALRDELVRTWSFPELFGSFGGRSWQISPLFAGPAFDPTFREMPVLALRASYRTSAPGREREHLMPWLLFGAVPSRPTAYPDWTSVSETFLMAGRARRRRLPSTAKSPSGLRLSVGASEPPVESILNSPRALESYGDWESLVGKRDWRGRPLSPLLVGNPPWITLYLGVRPGVSASAFTGLPTSLDGLIAHLERAAGAPTAAELPIAEEPVLLRGGYRHPLSEPIFRCPRCGVNTRVERGVNAALVPVNLLTRCCREQLFAGEPTT
jgi:hypothetical protein